MNFVSMEQIERQYDERMKQDNDIRFIVELIGTNEPRISGYTGTEVGQREGCRFGHLLERRICEVKAMENRSRLLCLKCVSSS